MPAVVDGYLKTRHTVTSNRDIVQTTRGDAAIWDIHDRQRWPH